jgi:hypothetical protein
VSPSRYQLEGASLAEVTARAQAQYGPQAKIIAAEAVTTGGISGFFAQRHYEVTIEVPDDTAQDAHAFDLPARAGIAALLEDADNADLGVVSAPTTPRLSTDSVDFTAIMADLTVNTMRPVPKPVASTGPATLTGAGDLVVVVGLAGDSLRIARTMLVNPGESALRIAGDLYEPTLGRVDDRRSLLGARASGVEGGHSVMVAFGLGSATFDFAKTDALRRLHPDQVWVVVDASRKQSDTERWVSAVKSAVTVDGAVAFGRELTSTPESVAEFGLPVRWV